MSAQSAYKGLVVPVTDQPIKTPPEGHITIYAKPDQTVWVKHSDGTETRIDG